MQEKGDQGTCRKDTWTKPKDTWIEGGRQGWVGWGGVEGGGKWRQLYLKKNFFKGEKTQNFKRAFFKIENS